MPLLGSAVATQTCVVPDSVVSMGFGPQFGLPDAPRPYHGRAFRIADLPNIVREYGLPGDAAGTGYESYWRRPFEVFIEVQVWSDGPLRPYLAGQRSSD